MILRSALPHLATRTVAQTKTATGTWPARLAELSDWKAGPTQAWAQDPVAVATAALIVQAPTRKYLPRWDLRQSTRF